MIDTLKLLIPIKDELLLKKLEGNLTRFRKEDLRKGETIFEFHSSNVELGSYRRNVMIKSSQNPAGLFIECSFAKYDKGNNVEMIYPHDLLSIGDRLYRELCEHLSYALPSISTWPVYRLDVCYNWLFDSHDEALYAMDFIQRIDYPRKKKLLWDTSVMYQGTAYSVKFYLKGDEFLKHDFKEIDPARAFSLQQWAKRILRYEVGLRRVYLSNFMGLKNVYLSDIASDDVILDMLKHYLDKVFKYINAKTTETAEVRDILRQKFSKTKAMRLFQFHQGFYFNPEIKAMYLSGGLDRSTIFRYKRDLKQAGIGFSVGETKGILEKLVLPSPTTRFELPEDSDNNSMQL